MTGSKFSTQWIVGKRVDLAAFIGGALAGYLVFFMHAGLGWDMLLIYVLFITFLDTPHFFGTYLRTYLDRQEFQARRTLLLGSLLWLLAGPVFLLISYLLFLAGCRDYLLPFIGFTLFVGIWAYWHVVRQHYGFMRLYQVKNGEKNPAEVRQDGRLMHLGLMLPFVVFALHHPESRRAFGLPAAVPAMPSLAELGGVGGLLRGSWIGRVSWEHLVTVAVALTLIVLVAQFVGRQLAKTRRGEPLNLPKILLFTAVLPLHSLVCFSPQTLTAPLITFSAFVTIYHDIQYHVLVYCHQQNRFRNNARARDHGLAALLSSNVLIFACSAVAFGLLVRGFGCSIQLYTNHCITPTLVGKVHLFGTVSSDTLVGAIFLGFPCHHYFVDQFIWKPSRDSGLRRDLHLEPARA